MDNWWITHWCFRTITGRDGRKEWVWRFPTDDILTPTGDLVTRFEAERLVGLNDDDNFAPGGEAGR